MKIILVLILLAIPLVSANEWVSPATPVINGNNWVFVTHNTTASTDLNFTIKDPSGVAKRECLVTTNAYGYARCKYNFTSSDVNGTWTYVINDSTSGNFNVSKISMSLSLAKGKTSVSFGGHVQVRANITLNGSIQKPIVPRGISRDFGSHAGKNDFVDLDGDGDLEIVIVDYNGRIWVWENISRFYNEGQMLITGQEWRTNDLGTMYLFTGCDYGDFDGDGAMTIICSEYSHAELFALVDRHPSATRDISPDFTTADQGDSIRTEPIICDVTGDGIPDQVAVNIYQGYMEVWDFDDTTGFNLNYKSPDLGTGHYGTKALCNDFDGDGYNEWMLCIYDRGCYYANVTDRGGTNQVVLGDQQPDHGSYYSHGDSADLDGDGVIDYVISNTAGRPEAYHYNTSTGIIDETVAYNAAADVGSYSYGGSAITIGDYNLDGKPDFVITGTSVQTRFYQLNSVNNDWDETILGDGYDSTYVENAYVDFDGDGIKEIMAFGRYSGNVYIYRFNGEDWDLMYEGWDHDYTEHSNQGDGLVFGGSMNSWLYGLQCAQGDIDGDGLGEAVCPIYNGRSIFYEQAERYEENVSAEIDITASSDQAYVLDPGLQMADLRIREDKTLALLSNIALGITDIVDEDNQNQGSINPRWADGVIGWPSPITYAQLDSSGTEEEVYSRIKFGANYTIGGFKMWDYYSDGRGTKNVIVRSTTDDSGNLCDFSTNDLLFDNSADGMNKRYQEDNQGKMVYTDLTKMSCLRKSTSGYSSWTTASSTSNYRVELEVYEGKDYAPINIYMDDEDESDYSAGDNVTVDVTAEDFTGNLISLSEQISFPIEATLTCSNTYKAVIIMNNATSTLTIE